MNATTTRHRLVLLYSIAAVVAFAATVFTTWVVAREALWTPGITVDNYDRIRIGASRAHVTELLGRQPDRVEPDHDDTNAVVPPGGQVAIWYDSGTRILVTFTPDGT